MFTWIPIVGPIIQGVVDIVKGQQDVSVKKYQEDTKRQGKETDADVAIIASRASVALAQDSIGNRLMRDVIMYPIAVHTFLSYWDLIFAKHPDFIIGVAQIPDSMKYLPGAVIAYLFVTAFRGPR